MIRAGNAGVFIWKRKNRQVVRAAMDIIVVRQGKIDVVRISSGLSHLGGIGEKRSVYGSEIGKSCRVPGLLYEFSRIQNNKGDSSKDPEDSQDKKKFEESKSRSKPFGRRAKRKSRFEGLERDKRRGRTDHFTKT
jgi:hypothetical protein